MVQLCEDQQETFKLPRILVGSNYVQVIQKLALFFNETLLNCYFRGNEHRCKEMFSPTITDVGLCYTFNGLSGREIYRTLE